MIITVKILGKDRELWGDENENNWFLNQPKDIEELGIYHGNTIEQWKNPDYLWRISPPSKVNQIQTEYRRERRK